MSINRSGKHARIVDSKRRHVKQMFSTKQGHPEPIRCAQGKLCERSDVTGYEILRCAQHDKWDAQYARAGTSYHTLTSQLRLMRIPCAWWSPCLGLHISPFTPLQHAHMSYSTHQLLETLPF